MPFANFARKRLRLQERFAGQRAEQLADEPEGEHVRVGIGQRAAEEVQGSLLRGPGWPTRAARPRQRQAFHQGTRDHQYLRHCCGVGSDQSRNFRPDPDPKQV